MGNLGLAGQSVGRSPQKSIHELRNGVDVAQNLPENLDLNYPQLKTAINKVYLGDFVQQERNFKASSLFNSGILYKSELVQVNCVTQTKSDANQINMLFSVELVNTSDHEILLKTFDITNIEGTHHPLPIIQPKTRYQDVSGIFRRVCPGAVRKIPTAIPTQVQSTKSIRHPYIEFHNDRHSWVSSCSTKIFLGTN